MLDVTCILLLIFNIPATDIIKNRTNFYSFIRNKQMKFFLQVPLILQYFHI